MKVRLVKKKTILDYAKLNAGCRSPFRLWLSGLKYADWDCPADILDTYGNTDLLGDGSKRAVFDIGGNNYRMICKYWFGATRVHLYVKWIGTHAEYTKICQSNLQYIIEAY